MGCFAVRFDREGGAQQVAQPLSDGRASGSGRNERRCTLAQITDEGMGTNGQPAFVQVLCHCKKVVLSLHGLMAARCGLLMQ